MVAQMFASAPERKLEYKTDFQVCESDRENSLFHFTLIEFFYSRTHSQFSYAYKQCIETLTTNYDEPTRTRNS